jgi:hypothetical protein
MFRVGLVLEKSLAVIHRLNPDTTDDVRPYTGASSGYSAVFREPIVYDDTVRGRRTRKEARSEYPAIQVPCQVEPLRSEQLRQFKPGDAPDSKYVLVFHYMDLSRMGLVDVTTNEVALGVNDRLSAIKSFRKPNKTTVHLESPGLYLFELRPGSFGFGPEGRDLLIAFLSERQRARS